MQASLAALVSVPKLPPETLAWLAAAEQAGNDAASTPIPGLDASWNALPFASVFADTFIGIAAVNAIHEIGHRVAAGPLSLPSFSKIADNVSLRQSRWTTMM